MERILVMSDSHGEIANMRKAVRKVKPDRIIHLGDCFEDAEKLHKMYADIPMDQVVGNCDWHGQGTAEQILLRGGFRVMICHGHAYSVKSSLLTLELAAREKNADIVLFGHTHKVFYDNHNGVIMLNPGSIGAPPYGIPASYAVLTLDGKDKLPKMETFYF